MPGSLHEPAEPARDRDLPGCRDTRLGGTPNPRLRRSLGGASHPRLPKPEAASPGAETRHVGSQARKCPAKPSPLGPSGVGRARMRIRQLLSGIRKTCDAAHLPFLAQPAGPQAPHSTSPHVSPHRGETPPAPRCAGASPRPFRPDRPVRIPALRPRQGQQRRQPQSMALRSDPPRLPRAVSARSPASPRAVLTTSRRIRRRSVCESAGSLERREGSKTRPPQVSMCRDDGRDGVFDQSLHDQHPPCQQCRRAGRRTPKSPPRAVPAGISHAGLSNGAASAIRRPAIRHAAFRRAAGVGVDPAMPPHGSRACPFRQPDRPVAADRAFRRWNFHPLEQRPVSAHRRLRAEPTGDPAPRAHAHGTCMP